MSNTLFPNKKKDKAVNSNEKEDANDQSSEAANFTTASNSNQSTYQNEGNDIDIRTQQSLTTRQLTSPMQPQSSQSHNSSYMQAPGVALIDFMLLETLGMSS